MNTEFCDRVLDRLESHLEESPAAIGTAISSLLGKRAKFEALKAREEALKSKETRCFSDGWSDFVNSWLTSGSSQIRRPASSLVPFVPRSEIILSEVSPAHSLGRQLKYQDKRIFRVDENCFRLIASFSGRNTYWSLVAI